MNKKERQVHFLLQFFFLLAGLYIIGFNSWLVNTSSWEEGLFEFYNQQLPVFKIIAGFVVSLGCFVSSFLLWIRSSSMYGGALFSSGILFMYVLIALGEIIYSYPTHAVPFSVIAILVLQSLPFLIRRNSRQY
ncbi:MAG: hypothetical protein ED557_09370 [Balneola sp.]|nr:MAG: hypothetical protein ED557_09370 [Balneola sp.]